MSARLAAMAAEALSFAAARLGSRPGAGRRLAAPLGAVLLAGLTLLAAPRAADAQGQPPLRRIAVLSSDGPLSDTCGADPSNVAIPALVDGLQALGYLAGRDVVLECRSAEGRYDRLDALVAELLRRKPAVIVAAAAPASLAARRATSTIPIVSVYTADPVGLGLVASLARPGGNVTGLSALALDHAAKSLELLREVAPRATRVGVLGHAANPTWAIYRRELEPAGRTLGVALDFGSVDALADVEATLAAMRRRGVDALLVMHQPFTFTHRRPIVEAVARHRLPAVYGSREAVELGGLLSYAASVTDVFRRAAVFVDRILEGATPASLPVEQPTRLELAVNLRAARALGLTVPPAVLLRADRVIE